MPIPIKRAKLVDNSFAKNDKNSFRLGNKFSRPISNGNVGTSSQNNIIAQPMFSA